MKCAAPRQAEDKGRVLQLRQLNVNIP